MGDKSDPGPPPEARQFDLWLGDWKVTWDVLWHIHYERVTDQSG